ncbi:Peroxiredoxin [Pedobacter steynii]|uniref:Peroxiredoxin n=2 Tax=Pedobacter steynii TaxID=430522 RepID=A0A1H0HMD0_9SPHI|nr:Peroxiredoxin [Pedobacter steynii]
MIAGMSLLAFTAEAQNSFSLNGKFSTLKEEMKVFLNYRLNDKRVEDSTLTKNGAFSFKGQIGTEPVKASLSLKPLNSDPSISFIERMLRTDEQDFFLEKGIITVKGISTAKTAIISGGKTQSEYLTLQARLKPETDQAAPLRAEMIPILVRTQGKGMDTIKRLQEIQQLMGPLSQKVDAKEQAFIKSHPDSYVSFDLVKERGSIIRPKTFEPLFNGLSDRLRNTVSGKAMAKKLDIVKKTAVGVKAMDFSQPDVNGKMVSLSSYKGKYVLLDFWASWCGPCRAENPNVLKAYNEFKDKNFDILAVSLDDKKENWLKAVKDDALPWTQVSDLMGWKNQAAGFYAITAIPQNFLIDPNGVIIASNLRGEELAKKLSQLIK